MSRKLKLTSQMSRCLLYYCWFLYMGHRSLTFKAREDAFKLRGLISKEADKAKRDGNDQTTLERGKLRMLNSFKAVNHPCFSDLADPQQLQHYAENVGTCRHINICRYFGEQIDNVTDVLREKYCDGMCDVCANRSGVYQRSFSLTEDIEVASPIIKPKPLEPAPEYLSLSTQAGMHSLAAWHRPTALGESIGATNLPTTRPMQTIPERSSPLEPPPPFQTPAAQTFVRPSGDPFTGAALRTISMRNGGGGESSSFFSPGQPRTIDDLADDGLLGGVVFGEARSPDHAEKKRKAREAAFKGVSAATPGGPFSFYNSTAPRKRSTKVNSGFKVPSFSAQSISQVSQVRGTARRKDEKVSWVHLVLS